MNKSSFINRKIFIFLTILFFFTRLYNLTLLPIFTDESIYIYWAKFIGATDSHWFISLTDGKPPLLIWIMTALIKIFPSDMYLLAGRIVSVLGGYFGAVGMYKLTSLLFHSKKTALLAMFLYIINPFTLFHDRLALYDSFLSAMLLCSVYFMVKTAISYKKVDAFLWGLFLGLALLTKPPAIVFFVLTPVCFAILTLKKEIKKDLKKIWFLPVIAIVVAQIINSIQKLSLNYQIIAQSNERFQLPVHEFFSAPFLLIEKNITDLLHWIISYYTLPIFLLGCIAFLILFFRDRRKGIILFILWIIPIIVFATVGEILFSRYILFTTPYFLISLSAVASIFLLHKRSLVTKITIVSMAVFFSLRFDYYLLTNPPQAPLPQVDYRQYISGEFSGYGLSDVFSFLDKKLDQGPRITLLTEGKFGIFPYAFTLKYWNDSRMTIIPTWIPENLEYDLYGLQKSANVYVVFREQKTIPAGFPLFLVLKAEKPKGEYPILLTGLRDKHE